MKKRSVITKLALASLFSGAVVFGGYSLYTNTTSKNEIKEIEEDSFVDFGTDELSLEQSYQIPLAINSTITDATSPAEDNGNEDTLLSSRMYVQYGTNSSGKKCMRFLVAVTHLDLDVTFTRTLKYNDTVTSKTVKPSTGYTAIQADGKTIYASDIEVDINSDGIIETPYNYFICYTMSGITDDSAELDVEVSVTDLKESTDEYTNLGTANLYNAANILGLNAPEEKVLDNLDGKYILNGIYYSIENDEATITKYDVYYDFEDSISIPEDVYLLDHNVLVSHAYVTTVGKNSFSYWSKLKSITLPSRLVRIGRNAFYGCYNLTSISLPESICYVGEDAFCNCDSLALAESGNAYYLGNADNPYLVCVNGKEDAENVTIAEGCKIIGDDAFYGHTLSSITFQAGLQYIGKNAFYGCNNLISIELPEGVLEIDDFAFADCSSLENVSIPNSIEFVGKAFEWDGSIITKNINGGNYLGNKTNPSVLLFSRDQSEFSSIESNCRVIYQSALECLCVDSFSIPESVVCIGDFALDSSNFNELYISKNVLHIGTGVLGYSGINYIKVDPLNPIYDSRDNCNAIIETKTNKLIAANSSSTIPTGVTVIAEEAFTGFANSSISIPSTVKTIEDKAFAFASLTSITIPTGVETIGDYAFMYCPLDEIFISKTVSFIDRNAFTSGTNATIVVDPLNPVYNSNNNCNCIIETETNTLICASSLEAVPEYIDAIPDYLFSECDFSDETVTIAGHFKTIGYGAFELSNAQFFILEEGVEEIGNYAFMYNNDLTSMTIPVSIKKIGDSAFFYCENLSSLNYAGTKEGWNAINKDESWAGCSYITIIHCSDGDISLE